MINTEGENKMAVISVPLSDIQYKYAQQFAESKGVSLSEYIRGLIKEKIEDFEDEQMVKELEKDMLEHPEDYENGIPFEEFVREFENEAEEK